MLWEDTHAFTQMETKSENKVQTHSNYLSMVGMWNVSWLSYSSVTFFILDFIMSLFIFFFLFFFLLCYFSTQLQLSRTRQIFSQVSSQLSFFIMAFYRSSNFHMIYNMIFGFLFACGWVGCVWNIQKRRDDVREWQHKFKTGIFDWIRYCFGPTFKRYRISLFGLQLTVILSAHIYSDGSEWY